MAMLLSYDSKTLAVCEYGKEILVVIRHIPKRSIHEFKLIKITQLSETKVAKANEKSKISTHSAVTH